MLNMGEYTNLNSLHFAAADASYRKELIEQDDEALLPLMFSSGRFTEADLIKLCGSKSATVRGLAASRVRDPHLHQQLSSDAPAVVALLLLNPALTRDILQKASFSTSSAVRVSLAARNDPPGLDFAAEWMLEYRPKFTKRALKAAGIDKALVQALKGGVSCTLEEYIAAASTLGRL